MEHVLFVCVHNSGRSQMAEAFFNHLAGGQARAISAGTMPAQEVDPIVVEAMREVGIEISDKKPKMMTSEMAARASRVITMGCSVEEVCPLLFVEAEDWELEDPQGKPLEKVREIRDQVRARVIALLSDMGYLGKR